MKNNALVQMLIGQVERLIDVPMSLEGKSPMDGSITYHGQGKITNVWPAGESAIGFKFESDRSGCGGIWPVIDSIGTLPNGDIVLGYENAFGKRGYCTVKNNHGGMKCHRKTSEIS